MIAKLLKNSRSEDIMSFIFNRRHLLKNGMISIILTTQKYIFTPTAIRSNITFLISFKLNKIDWKHIEKEVIFHDSKFKDVLNFVFDEPDSFFIYRIDTNIYYKKFDKINL